MYRISYCGSNLAYIEYGDDDLWYVWPWRGGWRDGPVPNCSSIAAVLA